MSAAAPDLPEGGDAFLDAAGWGGCDVDPIAGDASNRRYFRVRGDGRRAMLMHAPPPDEDPAPFLAVAEWLRAQGLRVPGILAEHRTAGWVLMEDFGDDRLRDWLEDHPDGEEASYQAAIDALVRLHGAAPGPFDAYDWPVYLREANLFTEWYCPARSLAVDQAGWEAAWRSAIEPMLSRQGEGVTVLRDYHAENIMLLDPAPDGSGEQGLLDFQDAMIGHPAYDLVSLLQDARRDVAGHLERRMLDRYRSAVGAGADFEADYAVLGAQRNAKIVGIFTRLWRRDGKARYLSFIPRVWRAMERDLRHPALRPVAEWFDANVPAELRDAGGGTLA